MNLVLIASRILGIYFLTQAIASTGYTASFLLSGMQNQVSYVASGLVLNLVYLIISALLIFLPFGLKTIVTRSIPEVPSLPIGEGALLSGGIRVVGFYLFLQGVVQLLSYLVNSIVSLGIQEVRLVLGSGGEVTSLTTQVVTGLIGFGAMLKAPAITESLIGKTEGSET